MTREEYHRAIDAGVYADFERLELLDGQVYILDGQVYKRVTNQPPHAGTVRAIAAWLTKVLPPGCVQSVQLPIALGHFSEPEPEPDIAIIDGEPKDFSADHPRPDQTRLIVEVSDSSLNQDLRIKLPAYAQAGIPEYWVVDLRRRQILVHRDPEGPTYRTVSAHGIDARIETSWDSNVSVAIRDLIP